MSSAVINFVGLKAHQLPINLAAAKLEDVLLVWEADTLNARGYGDAPNDPRGQTLTVLQMYSFHGLLDLAPKPLLVRRQRSQITEAGRGWSKHIANFS